MNIIDVPPSPSLSRYKRTEVLVRFADKEGFQHHCEAIVLDDSRYGVYLLCASPCPLTPERTYCLRCQGFENPVAISLSEELRHVLLVKGRELGHVYFGMFQ